MNLERFYSENYHIVFGYLYSLCGDPAWAEDLTSETFLKAIIKIDSFDGRGKPSTWLCTIGKNLYINELKRRKRHMQFENAGTTEDMSMEDKGEDKLMSEKITQFVNELKEPHKQVFNMRLTGLNFREIGDAFGKSDNWARITFFRAKNEIRIRLEGKK